MNYIFNLEKQLKEGRIVIKEVHIRKKSKRARKFEKDISYKTFKNINELRKNMYQELNKVADCYKEQFKKNLDKEFSEILEQYKKGGNGIEIIKYFIMDKPGSYSYKMINKEIKKIDIIE